MTSAWTSARGRAQATRKKTLVAAAVTLALPLAGMSPGALANAARVDFAIGNVTSVNKDGKQRRLSRGSRLSAGDTVVTQRGRAQLRFSDGSYTSLAPNTEFRIDEYEFAGQETESSRSFFSLIKGGLRTITGAIGKLRKRAYRLTTPVATIGIRGTEYAATFDPATGLEFSVGGGGLEVCSSSCADFDSGQSGAVDPQGNAPQQTSQPPSPTTPPPQEGEEYSVSDDRNETGGATVVAGGTTDSGGSVLIPGEFYLGSVVAADAAGYGATTIIETRGREGDLVNAQFDSNGALTSFDYDGAADGGVLSGVATGGVADAGQAGGRVGWGRWTGGNVTDSSGTNNYVEVHYVGGLPTPPVEVPTTGTAVFALAGGTPPAMVDDLGGTQELGTLAGAAMVADFSTNSINATVTAQFAMDTYVLSMPVIIGQDAGGGPRPRNIFGGNNNSGTFSASYCSSGCTTKLEGFFAGPGASNAGITYKFDNGCYTPNCGYVIGAAGFERMDSP